MAISPIDEQAEVERKYDVGPDAGVPDLSALPGVARVAPVEELDQVATYLDTEDLALLTARVTLRRRVGGADDGWHLKLPAGEARTEVRHPIADPADPDEPVPEALVERVRAIVRDRPLTAAAQLRTLRSVHRLLDEDGRVVAELCDDRVEARAGPAGDLERWREWELELVDGPGELLDLAEPLLVAAGARRSRSASKLGRALAESLPPAPSGSGNGPGGPGASTADILRAYLATHLDRLIREDGRLRTGEQEGVHQMRIASRRMRSALASYAPVLRPGATTDLRAELRWLGQVLAPARDAQVIRERLLEQATSQPDLLVLGPVVRRIDDDLRAAFQSGRDAATEALDGERYFRLLEHLETFVRDLPVRRKAGDPAADLLPTLLKRDLRRVRRRHRAYLHADVPDERDRALHEVRKAAKRLRYSAESAVPVLGKRATKLARQAEALQELLGGHQDTVVARQVLRDLGVSAHLAGENGFTFGRLHALEESVADELAARYPEAYAALPAASRLSGWLRG